MQTIAKHDIKTLATEAAEAGDMAQYALCVRAINGDRTAETECVRVIRDARAQADR